MPSRGITEVRDFLSPPFVPFFFFSIFAPRSSTGFLSSHAIPRHNRSLRLPFSPILPFLSYFIPFHSFAPRSLTGFHYSHAIPRHNKSPRVPFSYIVPFPFSIFFPHHGPRPRSSIPMPPRGITGVHDSHFPNHCLTRIYFDRSFDARRKQPHVDLNDKDDNYDGALNK